MLNKLFAGGYYIYIQMSGTFEFDRARLLSPTLPFTGSATFYYNCTVQFWYHMYGYDVGSLNVYVKPVGSNNQYLLWSRAGNQNDQWHSGSILFYWDQAENFQVSIFQQCSFNPGLPKGWLPPPYGFLFVCLFVCLFFVCFLFFVFCFCFCFCFCLFVFFFFFLVFFGPLNGLQLAKMKKSIPDMSLPWNL